MPFATIPPDYKFTFVCRVLPGGKVSFSPPAPGEPPVVDRFQGSDSQSSSPWSNQSSWSSHVPSPPRRESPPPPYEPMDQS